jgi:serine/threonine protein kinase
MAPEQLAGVRADAQSDQFSFAVMAFEALTGVLPFANNSAAEVGQAMARGLQLNEATSAEVRRLVSALIPALAEAPAARYASMTGLLAALRNCAKPKQTRVRAAIAVGVVSVVAVSVVAAAAAVAIMQPRSTPAPQEQTSERSSPRTPRQPKPSAAPSALDPEAEIAREVMALTRAGRYSECAEYLSKRANTEALLLTWINCAEYAGGPEPLERACAAWNSADRHATRQHTPELCIPPLPEARKKARAQDYRACAELILGAKPTRYATVQLAQCSAQLQDPALIRRVCLYQMSFEPPGAERQCDKISNL